MIGKFEKQLLMPERHPRGDHVRVLYVFLDIAEYLSETIFLKNNCFFAMMHSSNPAVSLT